MAESIIGALKVLLNLDTAAFSKGSKEAEKSLGGLEGAIKSATGGLVGLKTILGTLAGGAFVAFLKSSVKVGEEIEKASDRLGISKEAYQQLTYAADVAGVSHETLTNVLGKFQKGLGKVSDGVTESQKGLGQLGLTLDDLKNKSPDKQFALIADRLSAIEDPARRAAIETQLLGRSGAELDVIFRLGSSGLSKFADEARRFGFILSDETIKKAAEADDEFDKMGVALKVAGVKIAAEFLPAIEALRVAFTSPEFQAGVKTVAADFAALIKAITENSQETITVLAAIAAARFGAFLGPVGALTAAIAGGGAAWFYMENKVTAAEKELNTALETMKLLKAEQEGLNGRIDSGAMSEAEAGKRMEVLRDRYKEVRDSLPGLTKNILDARDATDKLKVSIDKKPAPDGIIDPRVAEEMEKLKFQTELLKGSFDALPAGFPALLNQWKLLKDGAGELITSFDKLPPALQQLAVQFAVFNTFKLSDDLLGSWDKLNEKIKKVIEQNKLLPASSEAAGKGIQNLNRLYQQQMDLQLSAVQQGVSGFAQLAGAFAKNNKSMGVAAKAFGIAEVIISTARAVMKAYADLGPVFGSVAAAGMIAAGAAQIIKISAQTFSMGGSFVVPGGSSSYDSKMVPLALSPGERVDITPTSEMTGGAAAGGVLIINPIRPKDFFTGDTVREMVLSIDQWMRNGGNGVRFAQR